MSKRQSAMNAEFRHLSHRFGTALKDEKPVAIKCLNLDSPKEEEVYRNFFCLARNAKHGITLTLKNMEDCKD
jgi:hypothetical protein